MILDAPRAMRITADLLAYADHNSDPATKTHQLIGAQIWHAFRALGYREGLVLGAGDGTAPLLEIPDVANARSASLVADLGASHRLRRPVTDLPAWAGTENFDIVITTLPGYDVRLTYGPNIIRRRADQLTAALVALQLTREGGLAALFASHDLMDNPVPYERRQIAELADLIGAVRLPAGTHRRATGTDEVADLLLFRRRPPGEPPRGPEFEHAPEVYLDGETVTINTYFDTNIDQVLGALQYDPTGVPPMNLTVTGRPNQFAPALADRMDHLINTGRRHGLTLTTRVRGTGLAVSIDDLRGHQPTIRRLRRHDAAGAEGLGRNRSPRDLAGPSIEQP
ncbi:hypothetical protein [Georgenia subflava]|uniref:Uncharacterized protein n=1 Tax=Georgenia subflava TaxID=1622177 RepID=A0A6N7EBX6_9MICO|nr:hypothetical protein [Georgenia subflava]MPV35922.1 hypothetical protein [Georgenia subflava]